MFAKFVTILSVLALCTGFLNAQVSPPPPPPPPACPPPGGGGCAKTPSITLASATVNGKTISGKGTWDKGDQTFKSIVLFAADKTGGYITHNAITTEPTTGNWPNAGTLDLTVGTKGTYKVWAVLVVADAQGTSTYYGSGLLEATVTEGNLTPTPPIVWGAMQPVASFTNAKITGTGSYTGQTGASGVSIEMWLIPSAGGLMPKKTTTRDETATPPTWTTGDQIAGLTVGGTYNVFVIYSFTVSGTDYRCVPSIVSKTVPLN